MMQPEHDKENNSTNDLEKRWEVQSTFVERQVTKDEVNTVSADSPFSKRANTGFPQDMFDLEEDDIVAITNVWKSPIKEKKTSSESVNDDNCPSPPHQTYDEVDEDSNRCASSWTNPLIPTAVNGGSQEQSVARDGFNEAQEIQDCGIAWVSDNAWPKSRICKRAKNYRCSKKIDLKKGVINSHGTKPYDRTTSTTASIRLPKTSIIWPLNDYKSRSLSEKSQPSTSTYSGHERTDAAPPLKPDSIRIESTESRNQTLSMNCEPCIVSFDNRANEQGQVLAEQKCNEEKESVKSSNVERGAQKRLNTPSSAVIGDINSSEKSQFSSSPTSTRLVICEESDLSSSSNESTAESPKENQLSYEDETGKAKKWTRKHNPKRSPPDHRQVSSGNSCQSAYNESSNSNTLSRNLDSAVSNQSSTNHNCQETQSPAVTNSSENTFETPEYSISEPYSRAASSETINLRISSEYFSDSSSSYMSSPSDTSPVLMNRQPIHQHVMEEGSENSHTNGNVHLLNKNIEELRSIYESQITNQNKETTKEIGYAPLPIPHDSCHEHDNSPYIDWSPGEYHNSYYCYQTSPEYNPRADFGIIKGNSQQNQPTIESSQGFLPHTSRPEGSPENPKANGGKGKCCRSQNAPKDSSSSSGSSYDSAGFYSPVLSNANGPYYHDTDPLGLCLPSPGNSAGKGQIAKQEDARWPDTPRPEYYYPRPGFYSFWEGPRRSQSSPTSPTPNLNISEYETGRLEFLASPELCQHQSPIHTTSPSLDDTLLTEEDIRREIFNLVESIAFIKHKETVLLDAVEELERERFLLEGRLSSLIEKPLENGNARKGDYD